MDNFFCLLETIFADCPWTLRGKARPPC
jgi:hypothetical protein